MRRKFQDLSAVLHALKELELVKLSVATQKQNDLSEAIVRLRRARLDTLKRASNPANLTPSSLLGADAKWSGWAAVQIESRNIDLAQLAAQREQTKSRAQLAFGRAAAFDAICAKRNKTRHPRIKAPNG